MFERCQSISLKSSSGRRLKGWNEASDLFVSFVGALGNQDVLRGYDESAEILLVTIVSYSKSWKMLVLLHLITLLLSCWVLTTQAFSSAQCWMFHLRTKQKNRNTKSLWAQNFSKNEATLVNLRQIYCWWRVTKEWIPQNSLMWL